MLKGRLCSEQCLAERQYCLAISLSQLSEFATCEWKHGVPVEQFTCAGKSSDGTPSGFTCAPQHLRPRMLAKCAHDKLVDASMSHVGSATLHHDMAA